MKAGKLDATGIEALRAHAAGQSTSFESLRVTRFRSAQKSSRLGPGARASRSAYSRHSRQPLSHSRSRPFWSARFGRVTSIASTPDGVSGVVGTHAEYDKLTADGSSSSNSQGGGPTGPSVGEHPFRAGPVATPSAQVASATPPEAARSRDSRFSLGGTVHAAA